MKIAIIYDSASGNTKAIAMAIQRAMEGQNVVYVGPPQADIQAELYFVGSWTDKGMCTSAVLSCLKSLRNSRIAYFGTAGFGGSESYYQMLFQRIAGEMDPSNRILGSFYCQGKMPMAVRDRYAKMLEKNPDDAKARASLENFDRALEHPNDLDRQNAAKWATDMVRVAVETKN